MRIHSLELKQFRSFEELHIDFERDMTVLVGANGAGKTAIADAAAVAAGAFLFSIAGDEQRPIAQDDMRFTVEMLGSTRQVKKQFPASVSARGDVLDYRGITWERSLNTEKGKTTWANARGMKEASTAARDRLRANLMRFIAPTTRGISPKQAISSSGSTMRR